MTEVEIKVRQFFDGGVKRELAVGEVLLFPDMEKPIPISYIVKGRILQYSINDEGNRSIVNMFKQGAFFPLPVAINDASIDYFFEADTDVEVRQMSAVQVRDFLCKESDVMYDVLSRMYRGLDGLLGRMTQLLSGDAKSRILYELYILSQRFGVSTGDGIEVSVTAGRLAEMTGLTRETVSRTLKGLQIAGVVRLRRGVVTVLTSTVLS